MDDESYREDTVWSPIVHLVPGPTVRNFWAAAAVLWLSRTTIYSPRQNRPEGFAERLFIVGRGSGQINTLRNKTNYWLTYNIIWLMYLNVTDYSFFINS